MFDRREEEQIRTWNDRLDKEITLKAVLTGDGRSDRLWEFAEAFGALVTRVRVAAEREASLEKPAMLVGSRVRYLAGPTGTELAPFLEAVERFGAAWLPGRTVLDPEPGTAGHEVRVYVSPHCPHCPVAVRALLTVLGDDPSVTLTVIDAESFADMAADDRVRSVPTVIAGRFYRSAGSVSVGEFRAALAGLAPDGVAIGRMLDGGDAATVAGMMADRGEVFPALLDLMADDTMTVRLGAMAAMERLIEQAPDVARTAEAGLWERAAGASREAAGDLIYMIGESGTFASVPWLEAFNETTADDDLREAVADALARIAERSRT